MLIFQVKILKKKIYLLKEKKIHKSLLKKTSVTDKENYFSSIVSSQCIYKKNLEMKRTLKKVFDGFYLRKRLRDEENIT